MPDEIIEDTPDLEVVELVETTDLATELEHWKKMSRKNQMRAADNAAAAKELEVLKAANLTDQERLIAATRQETELAIRREYADKLVESELKSALVGKTVDAASLLSFDRSTFIEESGEVDSNAIAAWVEAHTKAPEVPAPDLGQGLRGKSHTGKVQLTRADLANMTSAEILEARIDGRLDTAMGKN